MVAVAYSGKPLAPDVIIDETWFSDAGFCEKSKVHICVHFLLHALSFPSYLVNATCDDFSGFVSISHIISVAFELFLSFSRR